MFIRVQANSEYNLQHHVTREKDFTAGESDFGQISQNEAWSNVEYSVTCVKICLMGPLREVEKNFLDVKSKIRS